MTRTSHIASAFVVVGLVASAGSIELGAQGARQRGGAAAQGQAVPRGGAEHRSQGEGRSRQGAAPGPAPSAGAVTTATAPPPPRRLDAPSGTAVQRAVPRVVVPPTVASRVVQPVIVPPVVVPSQRGAFRNDHPIYRPDYRPNYRPQYVPSYGAPYRPLYRPYYTFRPRVSLGFGLWVGYPVAYPTYFYPQSPYTSVYATPYYPNAYPSTGIYPVPGTSPNAVGAAGGLSFEITPPQAGIYVDGQYVGTVDQFSPSQPPLALAPGRHHVEIREPGFEIAAFDVDIVPGEVIPYQGELRQF